MIVAELRVVPVGTGSSMEKTVQAVCEALDDCEVHYEVGPVGTTFEVDDMEDLMETVECCQEAAMETAPRIVLNLTIDERRDAPEDMASLRKVPGAKQASGSQRRARRPGQGQTRQTGGRGQGPKRLTSKTASGAGRPTY